MKPLELERVQDAQPKRARFRIGQPVRHKLFHYRGVIVDVDSTCQASKDWYDKRTTTSPPRDQPWYHVLVHGGAHMTYVAEQNMEPDLTGRPIDHPALDAYFDELRDGLYVKLLPAH